MIISRVKKIPNSGISDYCWRGIAQLHNIEFTAKLICDLHGLEKKDLRNAKKQAEQIKYCLTQAKEYYDASAAVSLATKPVLLYYCTMSLALAEILLKQTADSRLEKLRAEHNCHGLGLSISAEPSQLDSLYFSASKLFAKPQIDQDGQPKGTFEVWRRSAREFPTPGEFTEIHENASTSRYQAIFDAEDKPPPMLANQGISLYECLTNMPYLADTLSRWGVPLKMVRANVALNRRQQNNSATATLIIHPNLSHTIEEFGNACKFHPEYANRLNFTELPSGYIMEWNAIDAPPFQLPHSTCTKAAEVFFTCSKSNLGEFGYLYCAMHIMGNFARYYPDLWMQHIISNSPLANTIDDLCDQSLVRLPLLSLSELTRTYHVVEG